MALKFISCFLILSFFHQFGVAQPSGEADILASFNARRTLAESSILKDYPVRNIGPTVQGGRIVDIEVNNKDTKEFYVAFASGGVFRTKNNGITFDPVFDNVDALGVGDFALSQTDPSILYVGTGEKNASRSSYAGSGVYKTNNGGKSWIHTGLSSTHHVSRVLIHPQDNNTVWVAAIGALYTRNPERGVYKTTDGGKTWKKTLYINDSTGVIDMVINPKNPQQLLAATWERSRKAWHFKGQGSGSAIYRSDDGGETWTRSSAGFPEGNSVGRIGLKFSVSKPETVYAVLDNQKEVPDKKENKQEDEKLKASSFTKMSKEEFLKLDDKKIDEFLKDHSFPKKYTAEIIKREIRDGRYLPKALSEYVGEDANSNLFNTKVTGAEVYRSDDQGKNWQRVNTYNLDGIYYTYGYYFGEIEVSPADHQTVYIYGVPLLKSKDGGATWHRIDTLRGVRDVHVDHHALWVDPNDSKHILLGNDGGLYQSYDEGANWVHISNIAAGQFYTVNVDMETPYNVYGGLQDNGVLKGSGKSVPNETKHWELIFWGDGMFVAPDPRNSKLVYTGYQFGNYYRLDGEKAKATKITPQHDIGGEPFRWNWRTPLLLSKHNADVVYMASNKVHRSMNKGESWETISHDLTNKIKPGNVPFSSIASLAESPLKFGLLYAGTDDGNVWVSKQGGEWTQINVALPSRKWISSISPSPHDEATVFVSLNGYRDDDFRTYIFMSNDYGETWKDIKGNLPESVANIIVQDPVNPDLLYCGLDNGTFISLDKGTEWHLVNGMLNVASYDMLVHPRDNELVVGTHGRSVFVMDVKPLQALKDKRSQAILAFSIDPVKFNETWGKTEFAWEKPERPQAEILYYVGKPAAIISVEIIDEKESVVRKLTSDGTRGFHHLVWDLKVNAQPTANSKGKNKQSATGDLEYVGKGKYKVRFSNGDQVSEIVVEVK